MTPKEKAIEAFENVEKFISDLPMSVNGYNTPSASEWVSDQLNIVEEQLNQPTIDDCIAVVEKKFEKENERLRKIIQSYYSKSWLVTLSKNILAYNINFQMEIQTALKGLKEGK